MRAVIQRVQRASVSVNGCAIAEIQSGLLALVGVAPEDDASNVTRMVQRLLGYRVFEDAQGRMNLNLKQVNGGLLLVPNFTVMADTKKGMRPSFTSARAPLEAQDLFASLCRAAANQHPTCAFGEFGADMQVELLNDGPITLILEA